MVDMRESFCPYCGKNIDSAVDGYFWNNADCKTYFTLDCPECREIIDVEVEMTPAFILRKPGYDD